MNRNPLGGNNFGSTASTGTTASAVSAHQTACGTIRVERDDSTNGDRDRDRDRDSGSVGQTEIALGAVAAILILFVALS